MTDKMREEFESAYVADLVRRCGEGFRESALYSLSEKKPNGDYQHYTDCLAWWAWQASRESLVIELPSIGPTPEPPEDAFDDSYLDGHYAAIRMRNRCYLAIETAGVSVKP